MQPVEEPTVMQPVEVSQEYIEATLEVCDDGQDNDVDGKVDTKDEQCNATSSSTPSPIQEQSMSEDQKEGEIIGSSQTMINSNHQVKRIVKKAVKTMRGKKMNMITMNSKMKMMQTKVCLRTTFYF